MNAVVMHEEPGSPQRPTETGMTTTPSQLLTMAVQQGADLDRLERLMELQQKWEANEARKAFFEAVAAFKADPPKVYRDKKNKQYDSRYTSLANMVNTVNAALSVHGLNARWDADQSQQIRVTCMLSHVRGHSESVSLNGPPDTSGAKNNLQQIKSTLTYLKLATFELVTGVASEDGNLDDDGNAAATDPIDPAWAQSIEDAGDTATLKKIKADMVANWKGATNIPKELVSAYNLRLDALREAAKHE